MIRALIEAFATLLFAAWVFIMAGIALGWYRHHQLRRIAKRRLKEDT